MKVVYGFLPIFHLHTDSPEEKLNLVVNKAILVPSLTHYLPPIPPPHPPCLFTNNADTKHEVNQVHMYLFGFHSFSVFL